MTEVLASGKFACPACGSAVIWNPGREALVCVSCGEELADRLMSRGEIVEHDPRAPLKPPQGGEFGFGRPALEVKCQSCQAISSFEPSRMAQNCDFCGSASLVPYEDANEFIRPESLLPMKLSAARVREDMRRWYRSRWFAPNAFGRAALTDTLRGLYVPYWTFDAKVHVRWTALSGTHDTDPDTRIKSTSWKQASGELDHVFDDELVCGSKGMDEDLLREAEPFPTKELVPYDPGFLVGFVVERPQIDLGAALWTARAAMRQKIEELCARGIPGDTHRDLRTQQDFSAETFKHFLAPLWLLTYAYRGKTYRVVVNGYTGKIAARRPISWVKVFFAAVAIIGALVAILALSLKK